MRHFPRADLAKELVAAMRGDRLFADAHNGLFLAAPRRTGKSTFLQHDLKPELERQGMAVVYVDLWADQMQDPGLLIADAIGKVLGQHLSLVERTAKRVVERVGAKDLTLAGTVSIDLSRIGRVDGITLPDALAQLRAQASAPVVLIIDEAQHALTSEAGEAVMAALKSARDQMNKPGDVQLMLVMSGSDRDKLLRLVNSNGAPFFGSQIQRMPELGADFIAFVAGLIETQRPELAPVDLAMLSEAFTLFGKRPQFFMNALGEALSPFVESDQRFEHAVMDAAKQRQLDDEGQMESEYLGLKPLEQAVLWRMLEQGERYRPYDAEALRFYKDKTRENVTAQKAQAALESLRARTPALIWKSARGEYALDDAAMRRWYLDRCEAGIWPPRHP